MWTGSLLPAGLALTGFVMAGLLFLELPDFSPSAPDDPDRLPPDRASRGLAIAPVPLNLAGKDRALVGLGSYIVNSQGGCNGCHTRPAAGEAGSDPDPDRRFDLDHHLAGGVPFGELTASDLTPDPDGLPGGLSWSEFLQVMRTGTRTDGSRLQEMPWWLYRNMTTRDLRAIYEYLRAIPPAPAPTAERAALPASTTP